ncbi:MAG: GNAT family N-acetyltransferase [Bacteroidetes bacterium]|nr:GNAT family N-acetyltransferase [Bacteroidota bacterium]
MIKIKRTDSADPDFIELVRHLDSELKIRDGEDHAFYAQFNKIENLKYAVIAYDSNEAVGCGAVKEFDSDTMEIKRMFVPLKRRGAGIASIILNELEKWSAELNFKRCILETGEKQPEAIRLYTKNNYRIIANYGQYKNITNSLCFEKKLNGLLR